MKLLEKCADHAYALMRIVMGFMLSFTFLIITCRGGGMWCLDKKK